MSVCGIDEAGRGSMMGPLVVAGVSIGRRGVPKLASLGVRDSKVIPPAERERLYGEILCVADSYCILRIRPGTIDARVRRHGLNDLEAECMARVASALDSDTTYVDSCDVNAARFGRRVSELSGGLRTRSHHRADSRFAVVSAASILAKVERDRSISRIRRRHDIGSGYPSDPASSRFVREYYMRHRSLPGFVRKSWRPVADIISSPI